METYPDKNDPTIILVTFTLTIIIIFLLIILHRKFQAHHESQTQAVEILEKAFDEADEQQENEDSYLESKNRLTIDVTEATTETAGIDPDRLSDFQVQNFVDYYTNGFPMDFSSVYQMKPDSIPARLGSYRGKSVEADFFCFEQCPYKGGFVKVVYSDIYTIQECANINGNAIIDPVRGDMFIACAV